MAVNFPVFRRKFPLLVTGGLLAIQPLASVTAAPGEQFACQPSASGAWDCSTQSSASSVPRPQHGASSVSAGGAAVASGSTSSGSSSSAGEEPKQLVTESGGRGLKSRSSDYSHLD